MWCEFLYSANAAAAALLLLWRRRRRQYSLSWFSIYMHTHWYAIMLLVKYWVYFLKDVLFLKFIMTSAVAGVEIFLFCFWVSCSWQFNVKLLSSLLLHVARTTRCVRTGNPATHRLSHSAKWEPAIHQVSAVFSIFYKIISFYYVQFSVVWSKRTNGFWFLDPEMGPHWLQTFFLFTQPPMRRMRICFTDVFFCFLLFVFCFFRSP